MEETDDIPASVLELAKQKRTELIETLADADDEIAELFIEEKPISTDVLNVSPVLPLRIRIAESRPHRPPYVELRLRSSLRPFSWVLLSATPVSRPFWTASAHIYQIQLKSHH